MVNNPSAVMQQQPANNTGYKNTGDKNTGNRNTGNSNKGTWNTGNSNTGNWNTGNRNTGDRNTGDWNTGDWNTGDWNTGNYNTGHSNTGYWNTGNWNTGNWNTGECNTGHSNTGGRNTGDRNTGDWNTGDWNTGNYNTGYCNSITPDTVLVFNKPCIKKEWDNAEKPDWLFVNLTEWIVEDDMTDKEKEAYPSYVTTGGYIRCFESLKSAYVDAWEKASDSDKKKTFALPNYDRDVFKEVFGFDPESYDDNNV